MKKVWRRPSIQTSVSCTRSCAGCKQQCS